MTTRPANRDEWTTRHRSTLAVAGSRVGRLGQASN